MIREWRGQRDDPLSEPRWRAVGVDSSSSSSDYSDDEGEGHVLSPAVKTAREGKRERDGRYTPLSPWSTPRRNSRPAGSGRADGGEREGREKLDAARHLGSLVLGLVFVYLAVAR